MLLRKREHARPLDREAQVEKSGYRVDAQVIAVKANDGVKCCEISVAHIVGDENAALRLYRDKPQALKLLKPRVHDRFADAHLLGKRPLGREFFADAQLAGQNEPRDARNEKILQRR